MAKTVRALVLGVLLVAVGQRQGSAQQAQPAGPEMVPAPPAAKPVTQYPNGYGAVEAGQEAQQRAEIERQMAVARQVDLNARMLWYSGVPGYVRYPASVAAVYGYPPSVIRRSRRAARYAARSQWQASVYLPYPAPLRAYRGVFEPWPLVPGRIYGYPYVGVVPQPLGQVQVQIGPGVTLSRPVYPGEPLPEGPTLAPAQNSPEAIPAPAPIEPKIVVPEPPPEPPAPPAEKPGPREF